jgi:hypothetical protein
MSVSIEVKRARCTVSCRTLHVKLSRRPQLELSSYPFSKYVNFVEDVDLASSLLQKSRREIRKHEVQQTNDGQTKSGSDKTYAHLMHIYSRTVPHTHAKYYQSRCVATAALV